MFVIPRKLDHQTLRNIFRYSIYRRVLMRLPSLRQAARQKGLLRRLGMELV